MKIGKKYEEIKQKIVLGVVEGNLKINLIVNPNQKYICYFLNKKIEDELYTVNLDGSEFIPLSKEIVRYIYLVKERKMKYIDGKFIRLN